MNKILIIPDSFKGTMSSREVGRILEEEARACWPEAAVTRVEVADGGEGTVDAFLAVLPGEKRRCRVHGPFGEWVDAAYGRMGETAVIEMAAAAGLPLAAGRPGAGQASTYGVGELLADAVAHGARRIVLGLGGSATNDGGAGAAAALGVRFYRANGEAFVPVGDTLAEIARIDAAPARQALRGVTVTAICDIDNPLCGPQGAAAVFAPQKGAAPADLPRLDAGLRHLAEVAGPEAGLDLLALPGGGAAGGLGAGAAAFFGARLQSGIETVLDTVGFDRMLEGCSLVLTGEGRIDGQSARGKVPAILGKAPNSCWARASAPCSASTGWRSRFPCCAAAPRRTCAQPPPTCSGMRGWPKRCHADSPPGAWQPACAVLHYIRNDQGVEAIIPCKSLHGGSLRRWAARCSGYFSGRGT